MGKETGLKGARKSHIIVCLFSGVYCWVTCKPCGPWLSRLAFQDQQGQGMLDAGRLVFGDGPSEGLC